MGKQRGGQGSGAEKMRENIIEIRVQSRLGRPDLTGLTGPARALWMSLVPLEALD